MNGYVSRFRNFLRRKQANNLLRVSLNIHENTILLLKLDKIGDYILFRNFIEETHKRYQSNSRLILCGNIAWKELAEKLDGRFVDEFIWVDPTTLNKEKNRIQLCKRIRKTKCSKIMYCSYSRTDEVDYVVLRSGAKEKIGFDGDETNILPIHKKRNEAQYTILMPQEEECMFEFYRNKSFFEFVLNTKIELDKPHLKTEPVAGNKEKPYMILFPGAGHEIRRWSTSNFAALCASLYQLYKTPIHILGSKSEFHYAEEIIARSGSFVVNDIGKYTLYETVGIIQEAILVITNDSGPLHIAMAVNTPTICISNGNHYERFCPYPQSMQMPLVIVFPDEFETKLNNPVTKNSLCCAGSDIDVNLVSPGKVLDAFKNSNLLNYA